MVELNIDKKEELKRKIKAWFSNKYNIYLVLILIVAFIIRIVYFILTKQQPLWWDEAEYGLKAKSFAFGTPSTGWAAERELVIPFLFSIIFKLGLGEIGIRTLQFLMSFVTVFLTYVMVKKYLGKKRALFATFMMSVFWLHIFFSQRVVLYTWAVLLYLLISISFYKGYFENSKKWLYAFGAISAIALQTYFSSGFLLIGIFMFLLLVERSNFLKRKELWITACIFLLFLAPYAIYSQLTYGFPIPRLAVGTRAMISEHGPGLRMIFGFLTMMPRLLGKLATALFALAAFFFVSKFILGFDIILKNRSKKMLSRLYIFFVIFWVLVFYTFFAMRAGSAAGEGFYDAFIMSTFPFIFALISDFSFNTRKFLNKYYKHLFSILLILFIIIFSVYHIQTSDSSIKAKINSYDSVREGGIWIKDHTTINDVVVSRSRPQNTYYGERLTYGYNVSRGDFERLVEDKRPKYLIDSIWESRREWTDEYISDNQERLVPVKGYFLDAEQTRPSLIIYEIKYD